MSLLKSDRRRPHSSLCFRGLHRTRPFHCIDFFLCCAHSSLQLSLCLSLSLPLPLQVFIFPPGCSISASPSDFMASYSLLRGPLSKRPDHFMQNQLRLAMSLPCLEEAGLPSAMARRCVDGMLDHDLSS